MAKQTQNHKCPSCGAPLRFDGELGRLKCDWCESSFTVKEVEARYAAQTAEAEAEARKNEQAQQPLQSEGWDISELDGGWSAADGDVRLYNCASCGAELICEQTTVATACPYCGNPVVVSGQVSGMLRPDYVIPFKLSKEAAMQALRNHYKGKLLLPRYFVQENRISEIKGVYVPFWLYDGEMEADIRFHATRSHSRRQGDYRIVTTEHFDVRRGGSVEFSRIPVDAATKMPDGHMDAIEPFDYSEMVPFAASYLPGFMADKYDVSWQEGSERADARARQTALDAMRASVHGYATCTVKGQQYAMHRGKVHYALLPVWMLSTRWKGKDYLFAMNGQTGKLVGDLPMSWGRFWALFAGVALSVSAIVALGMFL
ncbi:MAG: hypothetical protein IKV55_02585 [Oscillospiraceae bacterium]|nr:hypothetical protein [Oscillospiraceae bacterium]